MRTIAGRLVRELLRELPSVCTDLSFLGTI